jgi:peptidoglycan/LPS O-acetylase OafA/YrhL
MGDAKRLSQIDALRGVAAMSVLLFHYTTRFDQIFVHVTQSPYDVAIGYLGVNLFFAISGFVIFMTLDRVSRPMDFVVSRFSRLFPAYWVAVVFTWVTLAIVQLPGFQVDLKQGVANLVMVQSYFWIRNIDGIYWSLQVELLFYLWSLGLWLVGGLRRPMLVCASWSAVALASTLLEGVAGVRTPYTVHYFLLLEFIPWFCLGIAAYSSLKEGRFRAAHAVAVAIAFAAIVATRDGVMALGALGVTALIFLASRRKLRFLESRVLLFLGAISYPLYLVHEFLGWLIILWLEAWGVAPLAAIAAALASSLVVATAINRLVEKPAMTWIRTRYKRAKATVTPAPLGRRAWAAGVAGVLVAFTAASYSLGRRHVAEQQAAEHAEGLPQVGCAWPSSGMQASLTLVLVAGEGAGCPLGRKDLATATFTVATRDALSRVVLSSSGATVDRWVQPGALRASLLEQLALARAEGHVVTAVLVDPGAADARGGTPANRFRESLARLAALLQANGVGAAPIAVARSTLCGGRVSGPIRRAIDAAARGIPGIRLGPDLDTLGAELRRGGCELNEAGRERAAALWRETLLALPLRPAS